MNDERLTELQEKYKDRNLLEELAWGIHWDHNGYTSKQDGEFLNWLCLMAYKALKERPTGEWILNKDENPECPFCHHSFTYWGNFCGNCGAKMK